MNKKALVTGASRGIGKAIAVALAQEHYDLYLTCLHSETRLASLADELEQTYNVSVTAFLCDMSSYEDVNVMFEKINSLDLLVNNAGISHIGLLTDLSPVKWHEIIDTNLSSSFYTCKQAIPLMLKEHYGRIINISSVWGNVGASMEVAYSASKGGLNAFTKALAKELAPSGISVNAISCGVIDTEMNHCFSIEERESLIAEIPADRMARPEEVASLVLSMLQMPLYTTGQIISLDGGWQ